MYLEWAEKTGYLHLKLVLLLCGWSTALWLSLQRCFVSSNLKAIASFSVISVEKVKKSAEIQPYCFLSSSVRLFCFGSGGGFWCGGLEGDFFVSFWVFCFSCSDFFSRYLFLLFCYFTSSQGNTVQGTEKMMATGTDEEGEQQCPSQGTRLERAAWLAVCDDICPGVCQGDELLELRDGMGTQGNVYKLLTVRKIPCNTGDGLCCSEIARLRQGAVHWC